MASPVSSPASRWHSTVGAMEPPQGLIAGAATTVNPAERERYADNHAYQVRRGGIVSASLCDGPVEPRRRPLVRRVRLVGATKPLLIRGGVQNPPARHRRVHQREIACNADPRNPRNISLSELMIKSGENWQRLGRPALAS
jgi:hypothetical protein